MSSKDVKIKLKKLERARAKAYQTVKVLQELEEKLDTALDVVLIRTDENYARAVSDFEQMCRFESIIGAEIEQEIVNLSAIAINKQPEHSECLSDSEARLRREHECYIAAKLSFEKKLQQAKVLAVANFYNSGAIKKYPDMEGLRANILQLRKELSETTEKIIGMRAELEISLGDDM